MEKGLEIKASVPPHLPLGLADGERIRQVFSNLIHNALKFTNAGGVTIFVRATATHLEAGVQDTGVGIPKDKLDSVFQKFECLADTRNRVEKPIPGSGLGLNIVMNSIKAQGGNIWVESEVDNGSTFIFSLPFAGPEIQAKYLQSKGTETSLSKKNIKIIPSEPRINVRKSIKSI